MDSALIEIAGYKSYRHDRKNPDNKKIRGGGLLTYISDKLATRVKSLEKFHNMNGDLESQWLEIDREKARNILLCNVYRPPTGNVKTALAYLNGTLAQKMSRKKDLFILGDLNVDYKNKTTPAYKKLLFFEKSNNLIQQIQTDTRITKHTSTILDLILSNAQHISHAGTLDSFISDHQPVYIIKKKLRQGKQTQEFTGRSHTGYNRELLREHLQEANWQEMYQENDINKKWQLMYNKITDEANAQCPLKKFRHKIVKPPYITNDLLNQIKDRDYFYRKAKKHHREDDWNIAKHLRNQTNKNIRKAKAHYTISQLDACQNNNSKFWRLIKETFPNKNQKTRNRIILKDDNSPIKEPDTAEFINQFFINVGNKKAQQPSKTTALPLADNNRPARTHIQEYQTCNLEPVDRNEIHRITNDLNIAKSSGLEHMPPKIIKDSLLALNEQFTHLVNASLQTNKFPAAWKRARVVPIPKTGDLTDVSNYRPISLLPTPGKILEKVVHKQLENHFELEELLTDFQHGFRKGRSTTHAITQLLNHVYTNMNNSTPTVALFIDFRKAFDCLQYPTLLDKLTKLDLGDATIDWIKDYLTDRTQCTMANGFTSPSSKIKQGVPQGSILGPLLYILYANDIPLAIKKTKFAFYADDTVLYTSNKKIGQAMAWIQRDLNRLLNWCTQNGILINPQKTKYVIFSSKEVKPPPNRHITIHGEKVERVNKFSYLGVTLDQHLTFDAFAKQVINRVSTKIYQLRKLKQFLSNKAALLVYKNMILPILEYGDIYLQSASSENRKKMQKLQNKALKCALDKEKRYNTNKLHKEAKLQKLKHRRKLHLLQHMYQVAHMPTFSGWKRRALIRTRSSNKKLLKIKKPNLAKFQNSITYTGPKTWNSLPTEIQKSGNYTHFKHNIKTHYSKIWSYDENSNENENVTDI